MARRRPDPAAWARLSDEELAARTAESYERERSAAEIEQESVSALTQAGAPGGDPNAPVSQAATRVSGRRAVAHFADGVVFGLISVVILIPLAAVSNTALIIALLLLAFPVRSPTTS